MPIVSVIIPCYNSARWLPDTLASVAAQRGVDLDIIIVDDGSTDDSFQVAARVCPHARIIRTENRGASAARNLGTSYVQGEFVQYLDADDLLAPGKLAQQVAALEQSGADVAYGDWQRLVEHRPGEFIEGEMVRPALQGDPRIALLWFWCPPAAYLFRREIVNRVGSWNPRLPVIQDARFALDCALAGAKFTHTSGLMAFYRTHLQGSLSKRNRAAFLQDCLLNTREVRALWEQEGPLTAEQKSSIAGAFHHVACAAYGIHPAIFEQACAGVSEMADRMIPGHTRTISKWIYRLLGYRRAIAFFHFCRTQLGRSAEGVA
jgi:glycosyltransferase involved in cell wall biosynthesis